MVQFFDSDGLRLAFIDVAPHGRDRGEPILLIHGFASNHRVNWVNPRWVETLTKAGRRVIAFDNRGHGASDKLYDPADYHSALMAGDAARLLDHLEIARADVMGYSMGARIAAFLALAIRIASVGWSSAGSATIWSTASACRSASPTRWRRPRWTR